MTFLAVIEPGAGVTVQDLGRPHVQHLGVPVSGALDPVALRLANALVGNAASVAALEVRLVGPTLEVAAPSVRLALAGTRTPLDIPGAGPVPAHRSIRLVQGQRVRLGAITDGGSALLAVEGGFDLPRAYGSHATYVRGGIGGLRGRTLRAGDRLPLCTGASAVRGEVQLHSDSYLDASGPVRIVIGPQQDHFTRQSLEWLLTQPYRISNDADRMGMRLDGLVLDHRAGHDIVSDGIVTGAIQVPGNGRPIILLADHQTTGGYPKIATVISADVPRLGRLRPGDEIRFTAVTVAEAEAARADLEATVERNIASLTPAGAWLDRTALYRENLISGVT